MRRCKICGEVFQYHVSNAHLETHDITRQEYNKIKIKEFNFRCAASMDQKEAEIDNYVIDSFYKIKKKIRNRENK